MSSLRTASLAAVLLGVPTIRMFDVELPYQAPWGPYRVVAEQEGTKALSPVRVRILDDAGHVLREVRDQFVLKIAFKDVTGGGFKELYLHTFSGGAHCCHTEYYFAREGGLSNLLIFEGRNSEIIEVKDLNGDRRPEIIAGSDVLAYFDDLPYAVSPEISMIIGWNGSHYVDQTRLYPEPSRRLAREYRAAFRATLTRRGERAEEERRAAAAGYYGNLLAVGAGTAARRWLLSHAPRATREWLLHEESDLRRAVASGARKIRVSQDAILAPRDG
jgi:hypothetical protein